MWFSQIVRSFFFTLDSTLFNFIPQVYDLLIAISRTSILTQGQIKQFADRIQLFLGVFMLFKVTFSLITYIVMPDEFSDKSKGFGKLWQNIIISLVLLILTPYAFNMAYEFQAMILEDNTLAVLVFGDSGDNENYISTAGEKISYTIIEPMFSPNVSVGDLFECSSMVVTNESGVRKFNENCKAVLLDYYQNGDSDNKSANNIFVNNYAAGVEHSNLGLFFRLEMAKATVAGNKNGGNEAFLIDYNIPVTTVVAVIVLLLLVTFCMDVALRSIKLSFLQLISPIPIIGYIDPKGKDGIFKKWYQMCFSTYLSLFVRLLALYLGIYIISKVNSMTDIITGASVTNGFVKIFIIVGVLMFAKQLPKILEGLGIKLDGDGKFQLNPFKKFEDEALGGKQIVGGAKGLATGAAIGTVGALSGAGFARSLTGAFGGLVSGISGKKAGDIRKDQVAKNATMRTALLNNSTFVGRMGERVSGFVGTPGQMESLERETKKIESDMKPLKDEVDAMKSVSSAKGDMKNRAKDQLYNTKIDTSKPAGIKYAELQKKLLEAKYKKEAMEASLKERLEKHLITQTQYAERMTSATTAFNAIENSTLEEYADWTIKNRSVGGADAAIGSIMDKTNATIRSSDNFRLQGITEITSFEDVKRNDGAAQNRITSLETMPNGLNELQQRLNDKRNSEEYSRAQANRDAVK